VGFALFYVSKPPLVSYEIPIEILEPIRDVPDLKIKEKTNIVIKSVNKNVVQENKVVREVFGAHKDSYTDEDVSEREAVDFKKGNTLTKEADELKLTNEDVDSLPEPVEEYLVSEMPSVLKEVRPDYPLEAKDKKIEGSVIFDLLIDQKGLVRLADVISGDKIFYAVALSAIKKFKFSPAKIDGKAVPIKIRYTLRFQLEY